MGAQYAISQEEVILTSVCGKRSHSSNVQGDTSGFV